MSWCGGGLISVTPGVEWRRRAISAALDREGTTRVILRNADLAATQLFPKALAGWNDPELPPLKRDLAAANPERVKRLSEAYRRFAQQSMIIEAKGAAIDYLGVDASTGDYIGLDPQTHKPLPQAAP